MNKMNIVATWARTGKQLEIEVYTPEVRGHSLVARIVGSDKVAELNLIDPAKGWWVFQD